MAKTQKKINWGEQYRTPLNLDRSTLSTLILNLYHRKKFKSCLEIGAGRGVDSNYLRSKKVNMLAIDNDKLAVELMKKRYPKLKVKCIDILKDKMNEKFDLIYSQGLIEHLSDNLIDLYFRQTRKIITKNGINIVDFPPTFTCYALYRKICGKVFERELTKGKIIRIAQKNGFKCIKVLKRDSFPRSLAKIPFTHISLTLMFKLNNED